MSVGKGFHMSDGSTGTLDWNYVTNPDGSKSIIEEVNVGFYGGEYGIIPESITSGYYVNNLGTLSENSGYVSTDYIDVSGNKSVSIKCTIYTSISFVMCTEGKAVVMYINGNNASDYGITPSTEPQVITLPIPSNVKYIRASQRSIYYSQPSDFSIILSKDGAFDLIANNTSDIEEIQLEINGGTKSVIPTVITGKYPNNVGGMSDNSNYNSTDYIDVEGYNEISINCTIYTGVAFCAYDSAKNLVFCIDGYNCEDYGITANTTPQIIEYNIPDNVKYIRAGMRSIYYSAPSDFNVTLVKSGIIDSVDVVKVGTGEEYTSILEALKNTSDNVKLLVKAGTYNIVDEYEDFYGSSFWTNYAGYAGSTDYFLRGLWINNGREIEFEPQANVVFDYSGNNQNVATYFSVFATGFNATIKNLRCQFNNKCRYAIHDDQGWSPGVNLIENCIFDGTSGYGCTIGGGMGANNSYIVRNCLFLNNTGERDLSYHNSGGSTAQNTLYVEGCYGNSACKILYHGTSTKKTYCMVHDNHFGSIVKEANTQSSTVDNMELISWNNEVA